MSSLNSEQQSGDSTTGAVEMSRHGRELMLARISRLGLFNPEVDACALALMIALKSACNDLASQGTHRREIEGRLSSYFGTLWNESELSILKTLPKGRKQ